LDKSTVPPASGSRFKQQQAVVAAGDATRAAALPSQAHALVQQPAHGREQSKPAAQGSFCSYQSGCISGVLSF